LGFRADAAESSGTSGASGEKVRGLGPACDGRHCNKRDGENTNRSDLHANSYAALSTASLPYQPATQPSIAAAKRYFDTGCGSSRKFSINCANCGGTVRRNFSSTIMCPSVSGVPGLRSEEHT